jgi:RNA polymerase sigma factor (sigma-70 family)
MAAGGMREAVRHLRGALLPRDDLRRSDEQLLGDYLHRRDEGALAGLVRRHGPMVWGVCRRVLSDHHDAEDAFQATFLVLVRKAASLASPDLLANWLYGVAYQTARNARASAARRRARETHVAHVPEPEASPPSRWHDLRPLLDQELSRLPPKYRVPVVLCDLEGRTRKEVARQLGCPEGTVAGRLARARAMLAKRLTRRGVALAGGAVVAGLAPQAASASVPTSLAISTIQAVRLFAAGRAATSGVIPVAAAGLAEGVLKNMLWTKLKIATALLGAAAVVGAVAGLGVGGAGAQPRADRNVPGPPAARKPAGQKKTHPAGPGTLLLVRADSVAALTPEGKSVAEFGARDEARPAETGRLSPDGTRMALVVNTGPLRPPARVGEEDNEPWPFQVVIRKVGADKPLVTIDVPCEQVGVCWSPDGKQLVAAKVVGREDRAAFENVVIDAETGKSEPLAVPASTRVLDWSRDGTSFLIQEYDRKARKNRLGLAARGGAEVIPLCDLRRHPLHYRPEARISPDGKKVFFIDADPENDKDAHRWGMSARPYLLDVADRRRAPLADFPANAQATGVAWSPDGKRLAYTWKQMHPELLKKDELFVKVETEAFLIVADADGKNPRTVDSAKIDNLINQIFLSVDWR